MEALSRAFERDRSQQSLMNMQTQSAALAACFAGKEGARIYQEFHAALMATSQPSGAKPAGDGWKENRRRMAAVLRGGGR